MNAQLNTVFLQESHAMLSRSKSRSLLELQRRRQRDNRLNRLGRITEAEVKMMSLPSTTCQEVNSAAANSTKDHNIPKQNNKISNNFYIKTSDTKAYGSLLSCPQTLQVYPKSMCPNIENHLVRIYLDKIALPLACPTCWSLQRNA
ncbi:uncharacterized protein LOC133186625 [Saccostrea echinata]|uniref:uncharacterized protein LOC133186625 n=1 Tax=Saccostrea echinata TaxID=191078 RepID=UPI002A82C288|nr:uncharacterized protein LOC133186625 [Saccostrea echinata]